MYVEFIRKDEFMPFELFFVLGGQSAWRDPNDQLFGQISRVGGMGPLPEHMAFCRFNSFQRLDEWESHFRSDKHRSDLKMHAKHKAIEHWRAGCYDEVMPAKQRLTSGQYYIQFFDVTEGLDLRDEQRRLGADLEFVLRSIGGLTPATGCLVAWSLAGAVDPRSHESLSAKVSAAGFYRDFA